MKCPFCGAANDRVVDSRATSDGAGIRRRRECESCRNRYTTYERVETIQLMIVKRDERREPFDRDKIAGSMRIACRKRPVSEERIQEIAGHIEHQLFAGSEREIHSSVIGESVMHELSELDQVAYVRFASVYRQFKDVKQFVDVLANLIEKREIPTSTNGE